eukprot:1540584-Prymnesium_polylepis.1
MWRARSESAIAAISARCAPSPGCAPRKLRPSHPFHYVPPGPSPGQSPWRPDVASPRSACPGQPVSSPRGQHVRCRVTSPRSACAVWYMHLSSVARVCLERVAFVDT